jgi:hypothetical protein
MTIYKYYAIGNENNTYSIKNEVVIMTIKGIAASTISEAKKYHLSKYYNICL